MGKECQCLFIGSDRKLVASYNKAGHFLKKQRFFVLFSPISKSAIVLTALGQCYVEDGL